MNPLTNVRNIAKLNEQELKLGIFYEKRSWHAEYKDSAYIFIGGLPYDLTEGDIICVFSQYGEIVNINLVRDKKTGKSKGYGFMAYEDQRSTILAVDNFNGIKLGGRTIRVDHVQEYRRPKGDEKDETGKYKDKIETGCAPKPVTPPQSSSENEDSSKVVAHASKKAKKRKKKKKKEERDKKYRNDDDSHSQSDTDSESEIKRKFKKELKRDREKHRASDIDDSIGNESEDDRSRKPGKETSKKGKRLERKYGSDSASVTKDDYENKSKKNKKPKRDDGETRISDKIGIDLNGLREDNYRKHREETTDRGRSYKDDYKEKKYRDRSRGDRDDHKMHRRKERGQEREKYDNYRETTDRGGKERDDRNRRDRSKEDRRSKRGRHKSGHSSETEPYRDKRDADYKDKYDKSKPTDSYKHR